jgi:hypothetical protein
MFTHANIDNVGIAFGYRHRTNGAGSKKSIGDISPMLACIAGFPKSSTRSTKVIGERVLDYPRGSY